MSDKFNKEKARKSELPLRPAPPPPPPPVIISNKEDRIVIGVDMATGKDFTAVFKFRELP